MQVNTNLAKLFPFEKEQRQYSYTNSTYDTETLEAGTLMGVAKATGKIKRMDSDSTDGSQFPIGVLAFDYSVEAGDTVSISVGICGTRVRQDMLVLVNEDDDLDTVIGDFRVFEWLLMFGIIPVGVTNATRFDNEPN